MALEADAWRAICFSCPETQQQFATCLITPAAFYCLGRTSDRQEPEMSPTQERMLEPRGDVWETAGPVLFLTSLASPFGGDVQA